MKKIKMLFVITHMGLGGAEKALVSLLNSLDYNKYAIDLQLYSGRGFNLKYIPKEVKVLGVLTENNEFNKNFTQLILNQLLKGRITTIIRRIYYAVLSHFTITKNQATTKYYLWQYLRRYIPDNTKHYDIAIGFLDGIPNYYVIDKVHATRKICWVHNDYSQMPICKKDLSYLKKANAVVTISPKCVIELSKCFPKLTNINLVYNLNSPILIKKLAEENFERLNVDDDTIKILSIGRLSEQKAYHLAIKAARDLKEKGYKFTWNVIGNGELYNTLQDTIRSEGVSDVFHLLGTKENPYPYMKNSDIIVQCSIYEGKSIALDEVKILSKPIVCTDYNSARDQIQDGMTGLIVPVTSTGIFLGVEKLIKDPKLRNKLSENLKLNCFEQTDFLEAYERLFQGEKCEY